jgi:hypothetical protein
VEPEPIVYREEVTAMLFVLIDISLMMNRIVNLLEGSDEEEDPEDDS